VESISYHNVDDSDDDGDSSSDDDSDDDATGEFSNKEDRTINRHSLLSICNTVYN
jgi:hypothetical protein